jgi:hypothetical protein
MSSELSMAAIVETLEAQIEIHREREAFHAQQEAQHREQRAHHAAELATLTSNLAAFKAAVATAKELARQAVTPPPPVPSQDLGDSPTLTKMVKRILEIKAPGEVFGPAAITREVNQHYGKRLPKRATEKLVSIALRRMCDAGKLRMTREGQPHYETLYVKA